MKVVSYLTIFLISYGFVSGQNIYSKAYGNPKDKSIIFLHGGPGYNSANFEATTAKQLAENGFYVIVYDRRGEGRSSDANAKYTFEQTFNDLNNIYKKYDLQKSTLIGHSFGGIVAILYAEKYPSSIESIILVGAPVNLQESFKTIISTSKDIYKSKNDSTNLSYIYLLEQMDTSSIQYSSYCFGHALQNGFYTPKNISDEAKKIYIQFRSDSLLIKYASQMTYQAPQGFWKNENYTTLNLKENIKKLREQKINMYAIYGKEDGLYSKKQVEELKMIVGNDHLKYFDSCSHNVFIDQQSQFISTLKDWTR